MKRYIYRLFRYLPAMLLTLVGTGCADDIEPDIPATAAPDSITLELEVPLEACTRAAKTETELNEFKVTTVHLYFYKEGADDNTPSVYDYVINSVFEDTNTFTVPMPANALNTDGLFGANNTCRVYAVANVDDKILPAGTTLPKDTPKTINQLKALNISSSFSETKVQDSFAMDGVSIVTIDDREARRASGKIELTRAAAKMTLAIALPGNITENDIEYRPNKDGMHVWIGNGVKDSQLNTEPMEADGTSLYSNKLDATESIGSKFIEDASMENGYKYVQDIPFYSYPNKWDATSPDGNTHLTLVVPWTYEENGKTIQISTYYRFAVQPEATEIRRNTHYDMRVSINRLGGTVPQEPVNMVFDWIYAIPWKQQTLETNIKNIRYLILNNNYWKPEIDVNGDNDADGAYAFEMNNQVTTSITLGTSHEVEIAEVYLSWKDYSQYTPEDRRIKLTPEGDESSPYHYTNTDTYLEEEKPTTYYAGIVVNNSESKLIVERALLHIQGDGNEPTWVEGYTDNNDTWWTTNDDFWVEGHWEGGSSITQETALNSYTFDIKIQHIDNKDEYTWVHITQYPAIYITADTTPNGTRFVNDNNKNYRSGNNYKGFYENQSYGAGNSDYNNTQKKYYLGSVHDIGTEDASNANTYIITISRFDAAEKEEYVVADPRTRDVNNLPANNNDNLTDKAAWSMSDGNNRQLEYYYPADDDPAKEQFIAPKIRVASQWGVTYPVTREGAQRRCASYQENGRPAGRWRLPTIAEIKFIASLSCKGYIPYLFGSESRDALYWCASGKVKVINVGNQGVEKVTETEPRAVRCVYDEWYWEDDYLTGDAATKFTWGDRERTITGNAAVRRYFGH